MQQNSSRKQSQKPNVIPPVPRRSKRPAADGRWNFIAKHMGILATTLYRYRKGMWPLPYNYDERLAAAEAAWEQHKQANAKKA